MSVNMQKTFGEGTETHQDKMTGLLAGATVLTLKGQTRIETLSPGDRIITRSGARSLRRLVKTTHVMKPIQVDPTTLGGDRPTAIMLLAPEQKVMVRDWRAKILFDQDAAVAPINALIDGEFIAECSKAARYDIYELQFDTEEVFYADGVETFSAVPVEAPQTRRRLIAA